jgi:hypothetical protein
MTEARAAPSSENRGFSWILFLIPSREIIVELVVVDIFAGQTLSREVVSSIHTNYENKKKLQWKK